MQYLADTQCNTTTANERGACLDATAAGIRPSSMAGPEGANPCAWKPTDGTRVNYGNGTNLNTLSGTCGMPQHFHGTITV
jgi:hypothetical protein